MAQKTCQEFFDGNSRTGFENLVVMEDNSKRKTSALQSRYLLRYLHNKFLVDYSIYISSGPNVIFKYDKPVMFLHHPFIIFICQTRARKRHFIRTFLRIRFIGSNGSSYLHRITYRTDTSSFMIFDMLRLIYVLFLI